MIWTTVAFSLLVTLLNTLTSSLKLGRVSRQKLTVDTKMKKTDSDAVMGGYLLYATGVFMFLESTTVIFKDLEATKF